MVKNKMIRNVSKTLGQCVMYVYPLYDYALCNPVL